MDTFYFCLKLTADEHDIVEWTIKEFIKDCLEDANLVYYRKLKDGHVPTIREVKISGSKSAIDCFKRWMINYPKPNQALVNHVVKNPYKE